MLMESYYNNPTDFRRVNTVILLGLILLLVLLLL